MRRRKGAAVALCAPLVAGCGAVTRIDFASHSRTASPIDVSVYAGAGGIVIDPSRLSPGPVEFSITNQTRKTVSLAVTLSGGRTLARSPSIPVGGTAQLETTLSHDSGIGYVGRPASVRLLSLSGPTRTGDDALTQP